MVRPRYSIVSGEGGASRGSEAAAATPSTPRLFAAAASCAPSWNILSKYSSVSLSCSSGGSGFLCPDQPAECGIMSAARASSSGGTPGNTVSVSPCTRGGGSPASGAAGGGRGSPTHSAAVVMTYGKLSLIEAAPNTVEPSERESSSSSSRSGGESAAEAEAGLGGEASSGGVEVVYAGAASSSCRRCSSPAVARFLPRRPKQRRCRSAGAMMPAEALFLKRRLHPWS